MRWFIGEVAVVIAIPLSACSTANPNFNAVDSEPSRETLASGTSGASTDGSTAATSKETWDPTNSTGSEDTFASGETSTAGDSGDSGSEDSGTGSVSCQLGDGAPIPVGGCAEPVILTGALSGSDQNGYQIQACETGCECQSPVTYEIQANRLLDGIEGCVELRVEFDGPDCSFSGLVARPEFSPSPAIVIASGVDHSPTIEGVGSVFVDHVLTDPCDGACGGLAGSYSLIAPDETTVAEGDTQTVTGFDESGSSYAFTNVVSHKTEIDCAFVRSWIAKLI
jgi:hypothetical protein